MLYPFIPQSPLVALRARRVRFMSMTVRHLLFVVLFALISPHIASAEFRLAQVFQDNMVLQRELKNPVWGWADAGAAVTVSFAGQEKTATADGKGYWIVTLDPLTANEKPQTLTVKSGATTVERKNVLVGEVWVLGGQSNMARPLSHESFDYPFYKKYYDDAEYPLIRYMPFGMGASSVPLDDVEPMLRKDAPWSILSKSTAPEVMSIGFFFAKRIAAELKVPVGLVGVAVPGTPQSAWMAKETLESFPADKGGKGNFYQSLFDDMETRVSKGKGHYAKFADYEAKLDAWRKDPAPAPRSWPGDDVITDYPSVLYNARVHPLAPFAFRGMLWHQGEAGPGGDYGGRMLATIKQHRELFHNDFYFIFGTLTRKTMVPPPLSPQLVSFATINQSMIQGDKAFGENGREALVNFFDLGDPGTHWARKEEAGRRMALAALDRAYGQKEIFTGPELLEGKIDGGKVTCKFRYVGTGLKYEPSIDSISGFVIVDKKGTREWADVKITGPDTLVISSAKIPAPVAVCYGWHINPHETLFNSEGFPAFTFSVGTIPGGKSDDTAAIAKIASGGNEKSQLNICHVRRDGYNFEAVENKAGTGTNVMVKAYVPSEWKGLEVRLGDKVIQPSKTSEDNGKKFIEIEAPVNGGQITVAEQGHGEALSKIIRP